MGSQGLLLLIFKKNFDDDNQATKHYCCQPTARGQWQATVMFCGLVIIIKTFNFITSRRPRMPILTLCTYIFFSVAIF